MAIHQQNKHMKDDALYTKGAFKHLIKDNPFVLLDGRRTPEMIEDMINQKKVELKLNINIVTEKQTLEKITFLDKSMKDTLHI